MQLTAILLTVCCLSVTAKTVSQSITYSGKDVKLETVFIEIEKQTGYFVFFEDQLVKTGKAVNVNAKNMPLKDFLEEILKDQPFTYSLKKTTINIRRKVEEEVNKSSVFENLEAPPVAGIVRGPDGQPLGGVNVVVKGTKKGTTSTGDGKFSIDAKEGDVLIFSSIGYGSKEIKVGAYNEISVVQLAVSESKLDEVQIIAYGKTTQRLSTGNVTTIKADVIEKQPVNNPLLALQGRVPGLFIEQASGFAGTGVTARIQGRNSLWYGSDPFYVVDGVPYISQLLPGGNPILGGSGGSGSNAASVGNPLNFINPSDIESIDILKDADATAIYGSRAANGAILITTKKGKTGDTRVNLNIQSGWGKVPHRLHLMNTEEYLDMRETALKNDGITEPAPGPYGDGDLNGNWEITRYTDWQRELIGSAASYKDMNASVSGGGNQTSFLIGAGYHRETTVFPSDFADQKGSLHFSISNRSVNQRFRTQFSGSYLMNKNTLPAIDFTKIAMQLAPNAPALYLPDGTVNWGTNASGASTFAGNPIGQLNNNFLNKTSMLNSSLGISYQLLPGLDLKSSFGYNSLLSESTNKFYSKSVYPELAQYMVRQTIFGNANTNSWTIEPQLTYNAGISRGKLEILLAATINHNYTKGSGITAYGFSSDLVMDDLLSAPNLEVSSTTNSVYKYNALFGKINYNWEDTYILNLTARRDGSSRFGPNNRFHNFAAIGAAWVFSNEKAIQKYLSFLSFGKIRGSYGTTGSDQIPDYQYLSLYSTYPQRVPYQGTPVYTQNGLTNPYLQWEETRKLQFGLDLGLLKERMLLNVNYYRNQSSNQLSGYTLPSTTGSGSITRNQTYEIRNSGWELMLSFNTYRRGDFNWTSSINLTVPKTLLVDYPDINKSSASATAIIGRPLSVEVLYHFLGVDSVTGVYQFADKNGNPTSSPKDGEDKFIMKDRAPGFYGGFQNTLSFKGLQLDFLFSFVKKIAMDDFYFGGGVPGNFGGGAYNQLASLSNNWKNPGDISTIQKFTTQSDLYNSMTLVYQSDAAWKDASYIRLKNVSLSWTLPEPWIKRVGLHTCNLFIQGQNLWTITRYTGLDPETQSSFSLPPLRVVTLGAKVAL